MVPPQNEIIMSKYLFVSLIGERSKTLAENQALPTVPFDSVPNKEKVGSVAIEELSQGSLDASVKYLNAKTGEYEMVHVNNMVRSRNY